MVLFIYIKLFLCYYNHIKKRVCKANLIGGKMGIFTKYNLFDSFDDYGKNEVLEAISSLNEEEQNILRKRFGDDYTGNKLFLFSTTDNIVEIYSEILPKIKKIIIENRKNKEFDPQELIPCINSGFSNEYMCNKFNLTRQELYKELSKLRNNGILIKNKYYSDGSIYFKSNNYCEKFKSSESIITGPNENYMKVLAISDLHFGSVKERLDLVNKAFEYCTKNDINIILCCGDFIDGTFSKIEQRIKNPYDQIEYFLKNYPHDDNILTFGVGGDHDLSAFKSIGIDIREACKNNRTDIIIPDYTNVDINIKNDNIHLYHSTINRKMSYTPSFICLHGHSHKFLYNVNGNRINVNIPSLSNILETNPGVVEISFSFYKGYVNSLHIKHISLEDEKVIDKLHPDISGRNVEYKPILNLNQYYERGK